MSQSDFEVDFRGEAQEQIDFVEKLLLTERSQNPGGFTNIYGQVFRTFHKLKDGAEMFDWPSLGALMHKAENRLQRHKDGLALSREDVDFFMQIIDDARKILTKQNQSEVFRSTQPVQFEAKKIETEIHFYGTDRTENLYYKNIIHASSPDLISEDASLLAEFAVIESKIVLGHLQPSQFSSEVIEILNRLMPRLGCIRVCLALSVPYSRSLKIVSAGWSGEKPDLMKQGYSCFLSQNSSLFLTGPAMVRIYDDIDRIIHNYYKQNMPVQKSLQLLKDMGVKSGASFPLEFGDEIGGFLFLNSDRPAAFNLPEKSNYLILCTLKIIAKLALQKFLHPLGGMFFTKENVRDSLVSEPKFDARTFASNLEKSLAQSLGKRIDIQFDFQTNESFLFPTNAVVLVLLDLLSVLNLSKMDAKLTLLGKTDKVLNQVILIVRMKITEREFALLNNRKKIADVMDFTLLTERDGFSLSINVTFDSDLEVQAGYSVLPKHMTK